MTLAVEVAVAILANCSYLIGTVPILTQQKGRKKSDFIMCYYFCQNLPVVMYKKFRNVPIFKDIPPICPYFLGFRVGKYAVVIAIDIVYQHSCLLHVLVIFSNFSMCLYCLGLINFCILVF